MTSRTAVDGFLKERAVAVVGVSRKGRKFGNAVMTDLARKGYRVFPVNPNVDEIDGVRCYPSLKELPEEVGGAVLVVPPRQSEAVVREAAEAGIGRVWMQQGAESPEAIGFCEENGIALVHGECIMMLTEPVTTIHRFHRWLAGLFGKLPS